MSEVVSFTIPPNYRLFTSDVAADPTVGANGDWWFYVTAADIVVSEKVDCAWVVRSTINGGGGGVDSVSLSVPTGLSVAGSPGVGDVSLAITTVLDGILKGNGSGLEIASAGTDYVAPGLVTASGLTMATNKLLGRGTATTGAVEEITLGTNLSLSGTTLNASGGAGGGDVTGPAGATADDIVTFDGGTGLIIKDGGKKISDINPVGAHTIFVPAAAMIPAVTNGCTTVNTVEISATQPDVSTEDYDPSTKQYAQFQVAMPKSWDLGTVTFQFLWSHAPTTTNFDVVWGAQGLAVSDNDAIGAAFGSAQTVTDTGGTTNNLYISAATAAITIGGSPASGDNVFFQVYRDAAAGGDNLAINARLHGVRIIYTTNAPTDN